MTTFIALNRHLMINELSRFFRQKAILVIDDDFLSMLLLQEYLLQLNTTVLSAKSCSEAMDVFINNQNIALVLLDIRLTDGCGFELCEKFRNVRSDVLIIAQTALGFEEDLYKLKNSSFDDFLIKPITENALIDMIFNHIQESRT
jgi:DNA-binding response OmpR family regulator